MQYPTSKYKRDRVHDYLSYGRPNLQKNEENEITEQTKLGPYDYASYNVTVSWWERM